MKKAFILLVLTSCIAVFNARAQSGIQVDSVIQTSFCAGGTVVIPYSLLGGDYNFGNIFTAQLSGDIDATCVLGGGGTFGNPLNIGLLPYWGGGFILGTVPDTTTIGTYRVRIISSDPPDTSNISPNCVWITNLPTIIFTINGNPSDDTLCQGDSVELSVLPLPISYEWSTGETTPTIWVKTSGSYTVLARDTLGCETESDPYTVEFETCIGVNDISLSVINLRIQPVPSNDEVSVLFTAKDAEALELMVYNLLGEVILKQSIEAGIGINSHKIDISSLKNGLYLLKIGRNESFRTVKLIKG